MPTHGSQGGWWSLPVSSRSGGHDANGFARNCWMEKIPTQTVMSSSPHVLQCLQGASLGLALEASKWCDREGLTSVVHCLDLNPEELHAEVATLFFSQSGKRGQGRSPTGPQTKTNHSNPCTCVVRAAPGVCSCDTSVRPHWARPQVMAEPRLLAPDTAAPLESAESQDCRARQAATAQCKLVQRTGTKIVYCPRVVLASPWSSWSNPSHPGVSFARAGVRQNLRFFFFAVSKMDHAARVSRFPGDDQCSLPLVLLQRKSRSRTEPRASLAAMGWLVREPVNFGIKE